MMAAAPVTRAPNPSAAAIVSRVERPVVMTSSTTSTRSDASSVKPSTEHEFAVLALDENRPHAERAPHFLADDDPSERGGQNDGRLHVARAVGQGMPQRVGELRKLEHERTLQITVAVQPRRQAEMPLEERA